MTRARTRSLPGQVTSAALDGDLRDRGQSGTHPRGDEVLYSGRTSPNDLSAESTPETEDSLANCGDSDNPGRIQLSGGGEQVSAEAGAGANQDLQAGGDPAGSTKSLARAHAPASPPSGSTDPRLQFDARNARDARQSYGAPIQPNTPEAVSCGQDADAHSADVLMLASTMAPANAQKYLVLVRLEHQMRVKGNLTMADGYAAQIMRLLDAQFSGASGSGSCTGSSGGSTGVGASSTSVLAEVPGIPALPRDVTATLERGFAEAMEHVLTAHKGSITANSAPRKVQQAVLAALKAMGPVHPPSSIHLSALVILTGSLPDEYLALLSASGEDCPRKWALGRLELAIPVSPNTNGQHRYVVRRSQLQQAYGEVINSDLYLSKLDSLLRSFLLKLLAPDARQAVQTAGNCAILLRLLFGYIRYDVLDFMTEEVRRLGDAPAPLVPTGSFLLADAIAKLQSMYKHRFEKHTRELCIEPYDFQLQKALEAFPKGEPGTPLANALADVRATIQAHLHQSDTGHGHDANMKLLEALKKQYANKPYAGALQAAESAQSGYYAGANPFGKGSKLKQSPDKPPKPAAESKSIASETAASDTDSEADKTASSDRGRKAAPTGGGRRSSSPYTKTAGKCHKGANCPNILKCRWKHTADELAAAQAAEAEGDAPAGGYKGVGLMAVAAPLTAAISSKLQAASRQVRFAKSASNIGTSLRRQPSAKTWAEPKRTARRPAVGAYMPKLLNPHSRTKLRKIFKLFKEFVIPMFKKWQAAGAAARRALVLDGVNRPADMARLWESAKLRDMKVSGLVRWVYQVTNKPETWKVPIRDPAEPVPRCNDGIQCKTLLATGKCALSHSPAEVSCAQQQLAEQAASGAALGKSSLGAAALPSVAANTAVDPAVVTNEHPPLYGRPCVMLALKPHELVVVGDSGATKPTGNLPSEYLHDVRELLPSHQFQFEGIGDPVPITTVCQVYMKVRAIVFDTDAAVQERFESCEYLGADALYYYFAVTMYPNSAMPRNVLLLSLGSLCKQQGWRVVLDQSPGAASYALTPPQGERGVQLTLKLRIGVKDPADANFDEDDSLVTLPDVTLLSKADLAQMPLFKKAEAEWDRAYERKQVMLANKAAQEAFFYEVPPEPAPLVFYVQQQEDTAYSLSASAYKF